MTTPGSGPTLLTARLRLVPCAEQDLGPLHTLFTDASVCRYLLDGEVVGHEWVAGAVASSRRSFADQNLGLWRLDARPDGALVGVAGLWATLGAHEPQLLYALDPAFWGRGLATEASVAVARYAFEELGFKELLASTDPPNDASIRVMERLGMRFLEAASAAGRPIVFYRMTREDWGSTHGAAGAPRSPPLLRRLR